MSKTIRFINPDYSVRFRIADGDCIRISRPDGDDEVAPCSYIDGYHVEVGNRVFHICEFAEQMAARGCTVIPLRASLPERCYSILTETGEPIILVKGEYGYYRSDVQCVSKEDAREFVKECNAALGVSRAQESAMQVGSMFGWDVPGADPAAYDHDGRIRVEKRENERDER